MAASSSSSGAKTLFQSLKRFFKAPWEITGPCADPEYRTAIPKATEYRRFSPATAPAKVCVPTSEPETVFDIKYYTRDRRRDRPPVRRTVLKKADVEKMMAEKTFGAADFPPVYRTDWVQEEDNTKGGGYQK
ncbi:putative Versican core protein [Cocos nucifera]|nr:putative Versican core protein [Cocos nucifera]